jgi:hypothetical protein
VAKPDHVARRKSRVGRAMAAAMRSPIGLSTHWRPVPHWGAVRIVGATAGTSSSICTSARGACGIAKTEATYPREMREFSCSRARARCSVGRHGNAAAGQDDDLRGAPSARPVEGRHDTGGACGHVVAGRENERLNRSSCKCPHRSPSRPRACTLPFIARHVVPYLERLESGPAPCSW